jgi:hypothetical protein
LSPSRNRQSRFHPGPAGADKEGHHGRPPSSDTGQGRDELRLIKTMPAPANPGFPYARQVMLIERYVTDRATGRKSAVAVLGVTALTPAQAGARRPRPARARPLGNREQAALGPRFAGYSSSPDPRQGKGRASRFGNRA